MPGRIFRVQLYGFHRYFGFPMIQTSSLIKIAVLAAVTLGLSLPAFAGSPTDLPMSTRFKGEEKFNAIVKKAQAENWSKLPIGDRVIKVARELRGTPYVSYTLEIDDHIEAPSVNFDGLDCWSFFEISLGMARMLAEEKAAYTPQDLLDQIQFTRYRGGVCTGNYLERIHYLEEWYFDNDARGVVDDISKDLGYTKGIADRKCQEMTILWKTYRYMRNNPELHPKMAALEEKISQLPVLYVPKEKIAAIEKNLKDGDIIGIVTKYQGAYCCHVGLAVKTGDGVMRFMHASSQKKYRRVVVDESISNYLKSQSGNLGIIVGRPLETTETVKDLAVYRANLKALTGGKGLISMNEAP